MKSNKPEIKKSKDLHQITIKSFFFEQTKGESKTKTQHTYTYKIYLTQTKIKQTMILGHTHTLTRIATQTLLKRNKKKELK